MIFLPQPVWHSTRQCIRLMVRCLGKEKNRRTDGREKGKRVSVGVREGEEEGMTARKEGREEGKYFGDLVTFSDGSCPPALMPLDWGKDPLLASIIKTLSGAVAKNTEATL